MNFLQFAFNNVKRQSRSYAAYFLSSSFAVMIFFLYIAFVHHPNLKANTLNELATGSLAMGSFIIAFFSFLFILYSTGVFVKARQQQFGILTVLGMSNRQLRFMLFLEYAIIGIASSAAGLITGIVFLKLFLIVGTKAFGLRYLTFYWPSAAIEYTLFTFGALFLFIPPLSYLFMRKKPLIQLLSVRKEQQRFRRISYFFALLSVVILIWCYYMPVAMPRKAAWITLAFPLCHLGIFWFYRHALPILIRWMKKSRRLFWKDTNLLTLADLEYRVQDNVLMFFLLTVILTVAFLCVVLLVSIRSVLVDVGQGPFELYYVSFANNKQEQTHIQYIDGMLNKEEIAYQKTEIGMLRTRLASNDASMYFMNYQTYEQLFDIRANKAIPPIIDKDTAISIATSNTPNIAPGKSFKIKNFPDAFQVKQKIEPPPMPSISMSGGVAVISDETYARLVKAGERIRFTGYTITDWKKRLEVFDTIDQKLLQDQGSSEEYTFSMNAFMQFLYTQIPFIVIFVGLFITAVFFMAGFSLVYFKLYAERSKDVVQFRALSNIGISESQLSKMVSIRIAFMLFVPCTIALLNAVVVSLFVQTLLQTLNRSAPVVASLLLCIIIQLVVYLLLRARYGAYIRQSIQ
ncbi:hypothetical protein BVG16_17290 [Paenibacillus selenitireducens]|uniref:ABC3 transporter permease C-terminal domain-containing protein n=1 Tax=Paenibacillus selenitireducens TaxID=1324314 RepID=A0A1T2XAI1_9BACL|nr:ABC transporter permease [Paenibacillus selenitireducens]OPA76904.1 hypothetical protein BVG16_17290 [Paenibacillus selenitireducens]